jgi:PhoH-like ATPase
MKKNYILDTNVLINDPQSIFRFEDNNLFIPVYVLEELDKIKSEQSHRGKTSREACRILDDLRCQGALSEGVTINEEGGTLTVFIPAEKKHLHVGLELNSMDNAILQSCLDVKESSTDLKTILVTMDVNLRVRAESIGIQTASYENQSVDFSKMITGMIEYKAPDGSIDQFFANKKLPVTDDTGFYYNVYVTIVEEGSGKTALGKYCKDQKYIRPLIVPKEGVMGIKPRNKEQQFVMDMMLDDTIKIVSLIGMAGSGKTLISSCVGLDKVLNGEHSRLVITRPIVVVGNDIGFLPGLMEEKLEPYMKPFYDNLEFILLGGGKKKGQNKQSKGNKDVNKDMCKTYQDYIEDGLIKVEPITYIRGRSLHNQFIIVDEGQNATKHDLLTMLTRCGENTKIIVGGDPSQIDTPYLDKSSCGLSIMVEKLHDHPLVGHITLSKGERSELANLATERFEK